jgi:hypothetical protein
MLSYQPLKTKPTVFKSFTGITLSTFVELLPAFRQAYQDDLNRRDAQRKVPRQRQHYSGKKKQHTVKNNVVTDKRTRKIKGLSRASEGKKYDKRLADEQDLDLPPHSKLWKDTGFQGYEPANAPTFQPKKKTKGRELTPEERAQNAAISSERIGVEPSIGGVKVFRIVHDVFRNIKHGFDDIVMETACGLHNLRLDHPLTA